MEKFIKLILLLQLRCSLKDPGQIPVWIQSVFLGGLDQAEVDCTGLGSAGRVGEQEVLSGYHKRLNRPFTWLYEYSDNEPYPNKSLIRSFLHQSL